MKTKIFIALAMSMLSGMIVSTNSIAQNLSATSQFTYTGSPSTGSFRYSQVPTFSLNSRFTLAWEAFRCANGAFNPFDYGATHIAGVAMTSSEKSNFTTHPISKRAATVNMSILDATSTYNYNDPFKTGDPSDTDYNKLKDRIDNNFYNNSGYQNINEVGLIAYDFENWQDTNSGSTFRENWCIKQHHIIDYTKQQAASGAKVHIWGNSPGPLPHDTYLSNYPTNSYYDRNAERWGWINSYSSTGNVKSCQEDDYMFTDCYVENQSPGFLLAPVNGREIHRRFDEYNRNVDGFYSTPKREISYLWEYIKDSNPRSPISRQQAEGFSIFSLMTDTDLWVWDSGDFNNSSDSRNHEGMEGILAGLYRISQHNSIFDSGVQFIAPDISLDGGTTWYGGIPTISTSSTYPSAPSGFADWNDTYSIGAHSLPLVRAAVNGCKMVVAATRIYGSDTGTTTFKIRYSIGGSYWYNNVTLTNREIYLGEVNFAPSLYDVTVNGGSASTPIFISSGTHTININSSNIGGTSYSYSVIYPSGSSVQLTNNGNSCSVNTNGATGSFYVRITATNDCGTTTRDLVFVISSGYRVYSNPTKDFLNVKFDSAENIDGLPESLTLYGENSMKSVKDVLLKEVFEKNAFKDKNIVELDVRSLPKGTYYLHLRYTTPKEILEKYKEASLTEKVDKVRIIIE